MKLYKFRAVPLPIIRSPFTVNSAMLYVIQVCRQLSGRTRPTVLVISCVIKCLLKHVTEGTVEEMGRQEGRRKLLLDDLNTFNAELSPICPLLALLGAHLIFHVSRIRFKQNRRLKPEKRSTGLHSVDSCLF